jgi:hypothetical protein
MQNNRFVVLTGHLSNYPLSDLVGILRHQRKSGRLLIEYPKGPATFFFQNGELIDARMNDLTGLQAICVALAQPDASFNFNPLILSPRRSIDPSLQRAVSELFGCWDESALQIETSPEPPALDAAETSAGASSRTLAGRRPEFLALPPGPVSVVQKRSVLLISAAIVIVVGLSTVIAVTGGFQSQSAAAPPVQQSSNQTTPVTAPAELPKGQTPVAAVARASRPAERKEEKRTSPQEDAKPPSETVAETQPKHASAEPEQASTPIKVVMQIENGRVLKASIANPKPGMDSYEAMALRIARQRRFPATKTGGETVTIAVNK